MRLAVIRIWLGTFCAVAAVLTGAGPAQAAFDDPLFVLRPVPPPAPPGELPPPRLPPITGEFEDPCGIAVDGGGNVWVSDYYHHDVDLFGSNIGPVYPFGYQSQVAKVAPQDGPCALAIDGGGNVYVNEFHRSVFRLAGGEVITGAPVDEERPTGVAVDPASERLYVNDRDHVAVFATGGEELGEIGAGSLGNAFGLAVSGFPGTAGRIYVPDAGEDTVKIYEPTLGETTPVATIDGAGTPAGEFTSLHDSSVAVDNATGEVYVADNLQPLFDELPETVIYVFSSAGTYEGRLKYSVVFGLPAGLAVDNSASANQGRVYVTTDNTERSALYAYPPGAATSAAVPLPKPLPAGGTPSESGSSSTLGSGPAPAAAAASVSPFLQASAPAPGPSVAHRSHPQRRAKHARHHRRKRHHR
jgi:hypothetical protein